jgi:hypothetical protein
MIMDAVKFSRRRLLQAGVCLSCGLWVPGYASTASIHDLSGRVYVNKRPIEIGDSIHPGDMVSTSQNGRIAFSLDGDAYLLKEFTSVRVGNAGNPLIDQLRLLTGKLLSVFAPGRPRSIITRYATIGIRGTACFLNVRPETTYFCNCYGKTELHSRHQTRSFEAVHHNPHQLNYRDGVMMDMQPASMLDHTDDELRQLESYVGRVPLFDRS